MPLYLIKGEGYMAQELVTFIIHRLNHVGTKRGTIILHPGEFNTDDYSLILRLKQLGYKTKAEVEASKPKPKAKAKKGKVTDDKNVSSK